MNEIPASPSTASTPLSGREQSDTALHLAEDTWSVIVGTGALGSVEAVFAESFAGAPAVVVADENTFAAAGRAVHERLRTSGRQVEEPIVFPGSPAPYADFETVVRLEGKLRASGAVPIATGTGTINDVTKLASHRVGRQYLCVATAASMDGYAAFGAAITRNGFKQTMACPAPRAIVADLDVLVRAPADMNARGYGDLLGKITAGADWILADALDIEPIDPRAWPLVQSRLRDWTAHPDWLGAGDRRSIEYLFEGLVMSGLAMQVGRSSRPASGSEHRFSHLWEMQALTRGEPAVPHGFKVGVGTIAAAALYERVLARDLRRLDIDALCRAWPSRGEVERAVRRMHDSLQIAEHAAAESLAAYVEAHELRRRLLLLRERWPAIRERLDEQLMPADRLRALLAAAGCPTRPEEIGVSRAHLRESYAPARTIRRRYTVLDLVYETGILEACVDELFAPGGFWSPGDRTQPAPEEW